MEINFNGSDRLFEFSNWRYDAQAPLHPCLYKYHKPSIYIYIYIYRIDKVERAEKFSSATRFPDRPIPWRVWC